MINYLEYLEKVIHTTVFATIDESGKPSTCVIDIMHSDDNALYFLTAKTKNFYLRLKNNENVAITGLKGTDTMSSSSINIRGKAKEIGSDLVLDIFNKNTYTYDIYPDEESLKILTVFKVYEGSGEFYDLSQKPIFRESFSFNEENK